jgi:phosphoserine aminotransferase
VTSPASALSALTPSDLLPADLLPSDGRFGCGPSKVRPEQLAALMADAPTFLGTSHRQPRVKSVVGSVRAGLRDLFGLPEGWEIVLGNGGSTVFWDVACFGLIEHCSQHLVFGEFSSKFAEAATTAPQLRDPVIIDTPAGDHPVAVAEPEIDVYAFTHNETSTGVMMDLQRPQGARHDALVMVDATSAAGGLMWDPSQVDVYYFAPQKSFASDGGLWLAACSPAAVERIGRIKASGRWIPASMDISIALDNSRQDQTYNTPALVTLHLLDSQIRWMLDQGGLTWAAHRCATSADVLYRWAEAHPLASPFVSDPAKRSHVVGTIDVVGPEQGGVDANAVAKVLRQHGIVDTESYRKLGRNQLRIGMFPAIDPHDVAALTRCLDAVIDHLRA